MILTCGTEVHSLITSMVSLDNVIVIISARIPSRNSVVFYIHNFELVTDSKRNVLIPLFIYFIAMVKLTIRRQV